MGPFLDPSAQFPLPSPYQPLPHWSARPDYGISQGYNMFGDETGMLFADERTIRENDQRQAAAARYHNQAPAFLNTANIFNTPMPQGPPSQRFARAYAQPAFSRFKNSFMGDNGMRKLLPWERRAVERQMGNIRQNQYGAGRAQERMGPSPMPKILPRPDILGRLGRGEFDRFG